MNGFDALGLLNFGKSFLKAVLDRCCRWEDWIGITKVSRSPCSSKPSRTPSLATGADNAKRRGASVFLQLINPDRFGGRKAFLRETTFLADSCRDTPVPPGKPPVRLPGQGALARRATQLANGVELYPTIMPLLSSFAERFQVPNQLGADSAQ